VFVTIIELNQRSNTAGGTPSSPRVWLVASQDCYICATRPRDSYPELSRELLTALSERERDIALDMTLDPLRALVGDREWRHASPG
jgi:hypothetical protein